MTDASAPAMIETTSDVMYRLLVQGVTDYAIYMLDPAGIVTNWNAGAERAKGYKAHEIVGRHFSCFYGADERAAGVPQRGLDTARATGKFETEGWRLRQDGTCFWAHVVIDAIYDDGGALIGFAKITRDRTEQRAASVALESIKDWLDLTLSNISHGVCLIDSDKRVITYNNQFTALWKIDQSVNLKNRTLADIFGDRVARLVETRQLLPATETRGPFQYEVISRERSVFTWTQALPDGGWVMTFEDVTHRRRSEAHVLHMAHHDTLTGLPNRKALLDKLDDAFSASESGNCSLIYVDLDRFKPVNDTLGHAAGDAVLKEVALRLRDAVRAQDVVSRIGGDEFAIFCEGPTGVSLAPGIAERLLVDLNRPFTIGEITVTIGCSMGIANSPDDAADPATLLQNADLALYEAKRQGRNCVRFYNLALSEKAIAKRAMELRLRHALARRSFTLHYQPIVAFATGAVIGFEALLRWQSTDGRFVSSADFIPLAEELGLLPKLGRWVMMEACTQAASWPEHLTVSVNVSAMQLQDTRFAGMVRSALAGSGLSPHRLELEITETAMLTDVPLISGLLNELRTLGVQVALDDFGTGFSSLSFLQTLPLTRIKLDRSFVRKMAAGSRSHAIVRAIIQLCAHLKIEVTAEGIETLEQHDLLAKEGCGNFQGWLISPARPAGELDHFLDTGWTLLNAAS